MAKTSVIKSSFVSPFMSSLNADLRVAKSSLRQLKIFTHLVG